MSHRSLSNIRWIRNPIFLGVIKLILMELEPKNFLQNLQILRRQYYRGTNSNLQDFAAPFWLSMAIFQTSRFNENLRSMMKSVYQSMITVKIVIFSNFYHFRSPLNGYIISMVGSTRRQEHHTKFLKHNFFNINLILVGEL